MADFNFVLLYVRRPADSETFYADLLGRPAIESSPAFAMFSLGGGAMLGLWGRDGVQPPPASGDGAGHGELALTVADATVVRGLHADWSARGLTIAQPPTAMDFGFTFVALDPDGHRLRVFAPAGA